MTKTIEQEMQDDLDQVVYVGFTRRALQEAFNRVSNKENWKFPINTVLPLETPVAELNTISAAVIFFTGSVATIKRAPNGVHVTADGYYLAVGP